MPSKRIFKDQVLVGGPDTKLTALVPAEPSDALTGKTNLLVMPSPRNSGSTEPIDPGPIAAGASPAARRLIAKRGLVLYQFVDTDGDTRVVARRHGVLESDIKRTVARMIKPVVGQILRRVA